MPCVKPKECSSLNISVPFFFSLSLAPFFLLLYDNQHPEVNGTDRTTEEKKNQKTNKQNKKKNEKGASQEPKAIATDKSSVSSFFSFLHLYTLLSRLLLSESVLQAQKTNKQTNKHAFKEHKHTTKNNNNIEKRFATKRSDNAKN